MKVLLISNFRRVLKVVLFILVNIFPYKYPSISLNLVLLHTYLPMKMEQSVPKRRDIKFR